MMTPEDDIAKIEAERAERKAEVAKAKTRQHAIDLRALNAAEDEHGDEMVDHLELPYTKDLPGMVIVRCPLPDELKVFRARLREKNPDTTKAAAELARRCMVYPDPEVFKALLEKRPGIEAQAGLHASRLAIAREKSEGED